MAADNSTLSEEFDLMEFVKQRNGSLLTKSPGYKQYINGIKHMNIYSTAETISLIAGYGTIIAVSLCGNVAVCIIVFRGNIRNTTYYLLSNIACSDLVMTLLHIPFTLVKMLLSHWIFGDVMCKMVNFTLITSVYVSTYTMAAVSLDKYRCFSQPLYPKWTYCGVKVLCLLIWLGSGMLASPFLILSAEKNVTMPLYMAKRCVVEYPSAHWDKALTVFTFLFQFLIPILVTSVAYGKIIYNVHKNYYQPTKTLNESNREPTGHVASQYNMIKMLLLVVLVFTVCWLPINAYHLVLDLDPTDSLMHHSAGYLTCHWLAMSSSCYNPIIYSWMHGAFRKELTNCSQCVSTQWQTSNRTCIARIGNSPLWHLYIYMEYVSIKSSKITIVLLVVWWLFFWSYFYKYSAIVVFLYGLQILLL